MGTSVTKPAVGKKIKAFRVATTNAAELTTKDLADKPYVLYFYPKDDTPGCTLEGKDFRDQHAKFKRLGVRVLGVSRDSLASHARFQGKYDLPFDLIADTDEALCRQFDVIKEKNMYGKQGAGNRAQHVPRGRRWRAAPRVAKGQGRRPRWRSAGGRRRALG